MYHHISNDLLILYPISTHPAGEFIQCCGFSIGTASAYDGNDESYTSFLSFGMVELN